MINSAGPAPLRVMLVGAGRRVRNNFLPALHALAPLFTVTGIQAPTPDRRGALADQWGIPAFASLDEVDFSDIDVVAVSVPTSQNATVLRQLQPWAKSLRLVIDTPIAWTGSELAACNSLLAPFSHVAVAEDYMNFPPFVLMREAVKAGLIGTPESLVLTNTGYLYHGLALIRSFADFKPVRSSHRQTLDASSASVHYRVNGLAATVIGPYRQHTTGGITLQGSSGRISEFEHDVHDAHGKGNTFLLRSKRSHAGIIGYEIEAGERSLSLELPALELMRSMDFPDKSDLNLLRGCGLMNVFRSLIETGNFNRSYAFRQAFYDSFVSRLATRGQLPFDPLVAFGSDGLSPILKLATFRTRRSFKAA